MPETIETLRLQKKTDSEDFTFRYESRGVGNCDVMMSAGKQYCSFYATYLGRNPQWSILTALDDMNTNEPDHCELRWFSEPGCLRTCIDSSEGYAHITVDEFNQDKDSTSIEENEWTRKINARIPFKRLVQVVLAEAERNIRRYGIVGFSKDWCDHMDVFPVSSYLSLKGITTEWDCDDIQTSSLEKELEILNQLHGDDDK